MRTQRTTFSLTFFYNKKRLDENGEVPVYMRITVNREQKQLSLKRSIDPDLWSPSTGKAIGNSKIAKQLNSYIDSIKFQIRNHEMILREDNKLITAESLMNAFLGIEDKEETVLRVFKEHNEKFKELVKAGHNAPSTLQRYETSYRLTEQYKEFL